MKKSNLFIIALICMMISSVSTFAREKAIPAQNLPATTKTFLKKNFPGNAIAYAKVDNGFMTTSYTVHLNDGAKLRFDKNGNWDKVNCKKHAVPTQLIPTHIATYVKSHFAGASIVKINKERLGYKVALSNHLCLKFNYQGQITDIYD